MGTIAEKLTYLDETRERIRQGINSIGGNLTNSDTFRSYSDAIDEIYEKFPKVEGEGSNITLENTMEASLKSELEGNTSQIGTPTPDYPQPINVVSGRQEVSVVGKNWFKYNTDELYTTSQNGAYILKVGIDTTYIDISQQDNGYYVNSYNNSGYRWYSVRVKLPKNTDLKFLCGDQTIVGTTNVKIYGFNSLNTGTTGTLISNLTNGTTFNSGNYDYYLLGIYPWQQGKYVKDIQIVNANTTDTSFEAYKGQTYEINLGKNLFDLKNDTYSNNGIEAVVENGIITLNGTATSTSFIEAKTNSNINWENGITYTISAFNEVANSNIRIRTNSSGTNDITFNSINQKGTITYDSSVVLYNNQITIRIQSGTTLDNFVIKPMLEKGSQATSYSPYKTPIELCKIGTYQDRVYQDNNTWYIERQVGKVVLNGSESWVKGGTTNNNQFIITNPVNNVNISTLGQYNNNVVSSIFSNYFTPVGNMASNNGSIGISFCNFSTDTQIRLGYGISSNINTVELLKTWLGTHNTTVYYVLATPTTTEITDSELIEQLAEFGDAKSYEGTTNINVDGDLPTILNVKALEDIFSQ